MFPSLPILQATGARSLPFIAAVFGIRSICETINSMLCSLVFLLINRWSEITTATIALIMLFIEMELGICFNQCKVLLQFNLVCQQIKLFQPIMTVTERPTSLFIVTA